MNELYTYTIFNRPLDHPDKVVVRKFKIEAGMVEPTDDIILCESVEEARTKIPYGLVPIERDPSDNPSIVETWI
jgi:hypothetical protein